MVPDEERVMRVVGDEHDPDAGLARLVDVLQDDPGLLDAERRGRLIEDQDLRPEVDRAGDGDALALATRQRPERLVDVLEVDPELGQLLGRDRPHLARCRAA